MAHLRASRPIRPRYQRPRFVGTKSGAGYINVYLSGSWHLKPVKVYLSGSWQIKPVKVWNGSSWVLA